MTESVEYVEFPDGLTTYKTEDVINPITNAVNNMIKELSPVWKDKVLTDGLIDVIEIIAHVYLSHEQGVTVERHKDQLNKRVGQAVTYND